jgi:hypothetical protein
MGGAAPPTHWTRDASRDIKLGCQDHHPAAIAPRPPPSDPQPIGRGARLPLRRRSRRRLSDTAALPIGAADRNSGLTPCRRWRSCWTGFRSGGTTCPPASQTARRRKRSMPCWSCEVMSKNSRRSSFQRASDGTDGVRALAEQIALATSGAVHIGVNAIGPLACRPPRRPRRHPGRPRPPRCRRPRQRGGTQPGLWQTCPGGAVLLMAYLFQSTRRRRDGLNPGGGWIKRDLQRRGFSPWPSASLAA